MRNWDYILNIEKVNESGNICSVWIINENNEKYIITNNIILDKDKQKEGLKVYDFNGNTIKQIKNNNDNEITFFDSYYDNSLSKILLLFLTYII